jgi:hypothetical protein
VSTRRKWHRSKSNSKRWKRSRSRKARSYAESELESIRELGVPQGDEATIEKLLDTAEEGNALVGEGAAALEEGDTQRFGELAAEGEAINHRATKLAENYGLKVCGQSP